MTADIWLNHALGVLEMAGIGTARLDALVLLEDVTGIDRVRILAEPELEIDTTKLAVLEKLLSRRARHEPLAYVRGKTEFYGRTFVISLAVLEPRPESETMIELLKEVIKEPLSERIDSSGLHIADVGTGSGALGITAALEVPEASVDLLDLDAEALKIAKINVDKFTLNLNVTLSDLLAQSSQDYDILLCNLPYVPDDYQINQAAGHEPKLAIFGGYDGLDVYRKLFKQLSDMLHKPLYILTEALPMQHEALSKLAKQRAYIQIGEEDFIQLFQSTLD